MLHVVTQRIGPAAQLWVLDEPGAEYDRNGGRGVMALRRLATGEPAGQPGAPAGGTRKDAGASRALPALGRILGFGRQVY